MEDLGAYISTTSEDEIENPMLVMAYSYARRSIASAICMQGLWGQKEFDYVCNYFSATQQTISIQMSQLEYKDTIEFQEEAGAQALELIKSYDSRFTDEIIISIFGLMLKNASRAHNTEKFISIDEVFEYFWD